MKHKRKIVSFLILSLLIIITFVLSYKYIDNLKSELNIEKNKAVERYQINDTDLLNEYNRIVEQVALVTRGSLDRLDLVKWKKYENKFFTNLNKSKPDNDLISVELDKFLMPQLMVGKHVLAKGTGYLDIFDNNLFVLTGNGFLAYTPISDLDKLNNQSEKVLISMNLIDTNIFDHIKYEDFYIDGRYGVKDLLIHQNKLYMSYSNMQIRGGYGSSFNDCFNTGILVAELNYKKIEFEEFYTPKRCVKKQNDYGFFNAHHAGGRIVIAKDKIIFTHGEYKNRDLAQDDSVEMGKILELNFDGTLNRIISKGHRNPQGLYYDYNKEILFSTEHGAMGGDEMNIVKLDQSEILNYGWPIASYGKFYPLDVYGPYNPKEIPPKITDYLNPKKKHSEFGFIEPAKFYNPSIGASQIIGNLDFKTTSKNHFYLVTSMGDINVNHQSSLYLYELNDNNKIVNEYKLKLDERTRDIVAYKNKYYLFFENSPSIGIISFN